MPHHRHPPLSNAQICVLLTGMILPVIPTELRFRAHGVYRGLVVRGLLQHDLRGGYVLTQEGADVVLRLSEQVLKAAMREDASVFPRPQAAE